MTERIVVIGADAAGMTQPVGSAGRELHPDHRGSGGLRLGLVNEDLVEAHGVLTVLLRRSGVRLAGYRHYPRTSGPATRPGARDQRADDR